MAQNVKIPEPPDTPKITVTDIIHGTEIKDHYRWLEDAQSPKTIQWTQAQNERTSEVLKQLPEKQKLTKQMDELMSQETVSSPLLCGKKLFFTKRIPGKRQPVLMVADLNSPKPLGGTDFFHQVIVDPNEQSEEGIVSLDWWHPSPDGSMLAYGLSQRGDEWSILHILDVNALRLLPEAIERTRYSGVTWRKDNKGFYYGKYPRPDQVPPGEENYHRHIFYHELGTNPQHDPKVFGKGRPKEQSYNTSFSDDGKYLLLTASHGWNRTDLFLWDETDKDSRFTPIIENLDAIFRGRIVNNRLFLLTNFGASKYRVVEADLTKPQVKYWKTLIPEADDLVIDRVEFAKRHIIVGGLKHAVSHLYVYDYSGTKLREIPMPLPGTITGLTACTDNDDFYFHFESFLVPPTIYRCSLSNEEGPEVFLTSVQVIDANVALVEQVFYPSKNKTKIPMFIIRRKDLKIIKDKPHPTVLSGYGGFNISRTPTYSPGIVPWIRSGGIYASANLRGGSEYGENWHKAGMLQNKQNVFDDFIYAGKYLIENSYTDKNHLGIWGRSNGGLLVGAALTQRPDLFRAVVCGVPLLDMIRYHKFLIAYLWCSEYGNPDEAKEFSWLHAYSPYHHVEENLTYPAVYFYTAASDSRVDPLHAKKMTALLQEAALKTPSKGPVLLMVETDAGHGVGKPLHKVIEEQSNMWAFLAWQLRLKVD